MDADLIRTVAKSPFLSLLAPADLRRLVGYGVVARFDAGDVLFAAGDDADRFHVLLEGSVGLCAPAANDPEVLDLLCPGDVAGDEAVFDRGAHGVTARALLPSRTLAIAAGPFLEHLDERFEVALALLAGASARLRGMIHEITELKLRCTTRRLANFLVGLAGERRDGRVRLDLPCGKNQLAERLGMQPESLSRAFAKLRPHGVTARSDDVLVDDLGALRRFCRADLDS
ncbi:MAG TPA: cyclic nucleotide-binding domain-containing protein [Azospirillum sp.]|nr:cyclic nucleotide-binding domain-containing protein [Azospirillum sp.]